MPSNHRSKAGFHDVYHELDDPSNEYGIDRNDTVVILKEHYQELCRSFAEYNALRNTLLSGGVTTENLEILINTGLEAQAETQQDSDSTSRAIKPPAAIPEHHENHGANIFKPNNSYVELSHRSVPATISTGRPSYVRNYETDSHSPRETLLSPTNSMNGGGFHGSRPPADANKNRRTLFFYSIAREATYSDLVDAVSGGALVDVWMKNSDRCASVSFVDSQAAEAYFRYAKKHDVYIKGHRVNIKWRESTRQFVILRSIQRQIVHDKASRVLVLRNAPSTLTEERLKEDMEHIANLRVEKIFRTNRGKDLQCNLNSICAALFARTCLKSRAYYKVCKIEFGVDSCARPLPDFKEYRTDTVPSPVVERSPRPANRFNALLNDDDGEEDDDDLGPDEDSSNDASTATALSAFANDDESTGSICDSNWAESTAAESTTTDGGADLGPYW